MINENIRESFHGLDILNHNRFLVMAIIHKSSEITQNNRDPSEIIPFKNQLIDNLALLNDENIQRGGKFTLIEKKPIKYNDESNDLINKFLIEIDNFSASKNNEKTTVGLQAIGKELDQNYETIIEKMEIDKEKKIEFFSNLEFAFVASNSIILFLTIIAILKITNLWKMEADILKKELIEKSSRLKNLSSALDETAIIGITDKHGIITYANKKFCEISKYSNLELIGKNHRILKSGFHSDDFYKHMWKTISSGKLWTGNIRNRSKNGTYYWVDTTIIPFIDNSGKIYEYVSIRKDITEFLNLQDKLIKSEKLLAIGELSSRLAHDLRNPLSIIGNSIEIIMETTKETFTIENCTRMQNAIDRMTHQIEDVMNFVRTRPLNLSVIPINAIIHDATSSINIPREITLKMPQNDIEIFCDMLQMVIVFNNILYNAVQKLDKGGVIQISAEQSSDESIIKIQDSGDSIPEEDLQHIFEPLFTTKQRGTGLGLTSCKRIIESHKGEISASNNPTTFIIKIPRK
jgi:PAS domain S-box-containing protein